MAAYHDRRVLHEAAIRVALVGRQASRGLLPPPPAPGSIPRAVRGQAKVNRRAAAADCLYVAVGRRANDCVSRNGLRHNSTSSFQRIGLASLHLALAQYECQPTSRGSARYPPVRPRCSPRISPDNGANGSSVTFTRLPFDSPPRTHDHRRPGS